MSRILLKISNESSADLGHIHVYGASGKEYLFQWDQPMQAFTYMPREQAEIEDIFEMMRLPSFPYRFIPVIVEGDVKSASVRMAPPAFVARAKYEKMSPEELMDLCADCGFAPRDSANRASVIAQLDAFYLGLGWKKAAERAAAPPEPPKPSILQRMTGRGSKPNPAPEAAPVEI